MFTGRQAKILEILLNNVQGVTGTKLAEYLEVSSRTVRNEVGEINRVWEDGTIIKASRQKGYFIEGDDRESVREYFLSTDGRDAGDETVNRGFSILGMVLESGEANLFDIAERLGLSESAVYKEIVRFQKKMHLEYRSELLKMSADRLWIEGSEKDIRQMLFRMIRNELQKGIRLYRNILRLLLQDAFDQQEYEWLIKLVKEYFDNRYIQIPDAGLYMVASAVYIILIRNEQGHRMEWPEKTGIQGQEQQGFFNYLKEKDLELSQEDEQILAELLRGFKMTGNPEKESEVDSLNVLILEEFCHDVMEKYHFDLWQSRSFYDNILIHIEYMMRRIETGYEVSNPILNEIKTQYPYAYEISMLLVPIVYRYKNCYIQDDEISYIAIFVEHFLENVNQKLKAVIISSARFSVSSIVSNWIRTNFQNQIEVTAMLPQHNLEAYLEKNPVDLIIFTMDTIIHPTIATFKVEGIPNSYTQTAMNALIHKIRMNYRFQEIIKENFHEKTIRIYKNKMEFEQVIQELSMALKAEDFIEDVEEYVNDVLQREVNYPTFVGNWFMIPHPLVAFAKKTAIGVAVLKEPIRMKEKEIQLIFLLAMERKQNERIGVLFQFFRHMALERSSIKMLAGVGTEKEFIDALIRVSNSTEH